MKPRRFTGRRSPARFRCVAGVLAAVLGVIPAMADVSVELADGAAVSGAIGSLTDASLEVVVDGLPRTLGIRDVRSITWKTTDEPAPGRRAVRVTLVDGSVLEGDDLAVSEKAASVVRDGRAISINRESIEIAEFRAGEFRADGGAEPAGDEPPAWLASLRQAGQEQAASDVVVVGSAGKVEFVECAIVAVTPDAVSVLLDDETIRVKRPKVIGLKWLRNAGVDRAGGDGTPPTAVVEFDGGRLLARRIAIEGSDAVVALDAGEPMRIPSTAMRRIDFAAGRKVSLVSLEPERVEIEPWFGLFKSLDGLAGHFKPRKVAVDEPPAGNGPREGLRLRPRTVVEWQLPEHARTVAMTLAESSSLVVISIDGREVYRGQPTSPAPVVADAVGGRRLAITVDFPPTGPGTGGPATPGVVLVDPRIER